MCSPRCRRREQHSRAPNPRCEEPYASLHRGRHRQRQCTRAAQEGVGVGRASDPGAAIGWHRAFERIACFACLFFCRRHPRKRAGYAAPAPEGTPTAAASIPKTIFPPWVPAEPTTDRRSGLLFHDAGFLGHLRGSQNPRPWMPFMDCMAIGPPWLHGYVFGIYDHSGWQRGARKRSARTCYGMAQRQIGMGTLTLRAMLSLDR